MLDFFWRRPSLVTGSLVVFLYSGYCPMSHSGFYCNDDSITFKRATIEAFDVKLLLFICIVPMMALFLLGELLGLSEFLSLATEGERTSAAKVGRFKVSWRSARGIYSDYWASSLLNVVFNELLKTVVAEPRPHFLDTCKPDWEKIDCTQNKGYVQFSSSICTASEEQTLGRTLMDAMRSFPSGHAQLSSFTAIFAIIYLQRRLSPSRPQVKVLKRVLQLAFVAFAVAASATRVSDRRHHWWDVAAGCAFGAVSALIAVKYRCRDFQDNNWSAMLTSQAVTTGASEKDGKSS